MAVDLSTFEYYLPILVFLLVFVVVFAVLALTKVLGDSKFVQLLIAFLVAIIFVSAAGARKYVLTITPWFAVLLVALTFILVAIGLFGKAPEFLTKGVGIVFVIGLLLVFLISAYFVFSSSPFWESIKGWVTTPKILGAIVLLAISALVSWILVKAK